MSWVVQIQVPFESEQAYKDWVAHCNENQISSRKGVAALIKAELKRVAGMRTCSDEELSVSNDQDVCSSTPNLKE